MDPKLYELDMICCFDQDADKWFLKANIWHDETLVATKTVHLDFLSDASGVAHTFFLSRINGLDGKKLSFEKETKFPKAKQNELPF